MPIDSKVDGIAASMPDPDALALVFQKAVAAGIPGVAFNAGDRAWQKIGALDFYGSPRSWPASSPGSSSTIWAPSPPCGACRARASSRNGCAGIAAKITNDLVPLLQNGKVAFTVDQQPYLQGYLSIESLWLWLWLYKQNKSVMGAQQSVRPARSSSTRTASATSSTGYKRRTALIRTPP